MNACGYKKNSEFSRISKFPWVATHGGIPRSEITASKHAKPYQVPTGGPFSWRSPPKQPDNRRHGPALIQQERNNSSPIAENIFHTYIHLFLKTRRRELKHHRCRLV